MLKPAVASISILLIAGSSLAEASSCPVINGIFKMPYKVEGKPWERTITIFTRMEKGSYSYTHDEAGKIFQRADGIARPIAVDGETGTLIIRCGDNSVIYLTQGTGFEQVNKIE